MNSLSPDNNNHSNGQLRPDKNVRNGTVRASHATHLSGRESVASHSKDDRSNNNSHVNILKNGNPKSNDLDIEMGDQLASLDQILPAEMTAKGDISQISPGGPKKRRNSRMQISVSNFSIEPTQAEKGETWWDKLCGYSLMMWDGLGFFGFATSKLGRLKGEKVTFWTNLKDY